MGDTDKTEGHKQVLLRLTQDDHARLVQLAAAQDRSMASVLRVLIRGAGEPSNAGAGKAGGDAGRP